MINKIDNLINKPKALDHSRNNSHKLDEELKAPAIK
jgi:hypothetical protein